MHTELPLNLVSLNSHTEALLSHDLDRWFPVQRARSRSSVPRSTTNPRGFSRLRRPLSLLLLRRPPRFSLSHPLVLPRQRRLSADPLVALGAEVEEAVAGLFTGKCKATEGV